jgi:hypothetical protein
LPKNAHIVVDLVQPSDLPPGTDAEFTVQTESKQIEATLRCTSARAAHDCFGTMLQAIRLIQQPGAAR